MAMNKVTPPYLPSRDSELDDAEWDRWMSLSEAEAEAEVAAAVRELDSFLAAMSPLQSYHAYPVITHDH